MRFGRWVLASAFVMAWTGVAPAQAPVYQLEFGSVANIIQGNSATFDVNIYWTGAGANQLFTNGVNSVSLGVRQNNSSVGSVSIFGGTPTLGSNVIKNPGFDGPAIAYAPAHPVFEPVPGFSNTVGFSFTKNVGGITAADGNPNTRLNLGQLTFSGDVLGPVSLEIGFLRPSMANQILSGTGADLSGPIFGPTAPGSVNFSVIPVPEPTGLLAITGLAAAGGAWLRRRRRNEEPKKSSA